MARPDYIARLHEAKYDLHWCERQQKPAMWRRYRAALAEASRVFEVSAHDLEAAVAKDFGKWTRDERLPKPPPPTQS